MLADSMGNETRLKLVYFGPGLAGKSTNMQYVHEHSDPKQRTNLISAATETERTLWCSLVPTNLPPIGGKVVRVYLYTVPGPVFYDASKRLVLENVDGVVFVADTQAERIEANLESMELLESNLESHGRRLTDVPLVIQYNKRDLPNRMPLADLDQALNPNRLRTVDAIARKGIGVVEAFEACLELAYERIPPAFGGPYRNPVGRR